jgi:hypothetical protein
MKRLLPLLVTMIAIAPSLASASNECAFEDPAVLATVDQLPYSLELEDLAGLTSVEVKVAFSQLGPQNKADLWRQHILAQMEISDWSEDQLNVLSHAVQLISPELFELKKSDDLEWETVVRAPVEELERSALQVFTEEEFSIVFLQLGGEWSTPVQMATKCNCNIGYWLNCGSCHQSSCQSVPIGCGFAWLWPCNGNC